MMGKFLDILLEVVVGVYSQKPYSFLRKAARNMFQINFPNVLFKNKQTNKKIGGCK